MFARKVIFDAVFLTYTFLLLAYFTGSAFLSLDQEFFLFHFSTLACGATAILFISLGLALLAHHQHWSSVAQSLFGPNAAPPFFHSFWGWHVLLVFCLTTLVSVQVTQASLVELLDREGLAGAWRLWLGISNPNFGLLARATVESIETIFIAFLATILAIPIAFLLAFFCAKNIMTHPAAFALYAFLRLLMNVSRSVEPLIWALIFTVWVGVGPFAGMLALMIHSIASLAKYYSEILESVSEGPIDGVRATGANTVQVIWFAIVPQVLLPYIAMTIYRWDTNVRMATVIGLVGGGGVGTLLIQYQGQAMWPEVGCIILVIAAIVWLMDVTSAYVREALK